ncbi:hypothetical protein L9F63_005910 [Diploptera punctata]|uniref:C-type lectin domain-containing protein n=1 Tax=Diploptera punctata TaxID=6984 RepID=A0AAD7ZC06_DIPPU|nr:hypothetical protein L9F63_005910 [Diploptera punctata]
METHRIFLFMLLCFIVCAVPIQSGTSNTSENEIIKISIFSRKNRTGQLYAKVRLEEGSDKKSAWQVDIDHESMHNSDFTKHKSPEPGYQLIPGFGYYKFHNRGKTWLDARDTCEKEGAHLAIINSKEESLILMDLFSKAPRFHEDWNFIGMTDENEEGNWMTIFNEPLNNTGFTEWNLEEPNNGVSQNCGGFHGKEGKLHDLGCENIHGFFCELEL